MGCPRGVDGRRRAKLYERDAQNRLKRRLAKLDENRTKLLQANFGDAVPLDLMKKEQNEISREVARIQLAGSNRGPVGCDYAVYLTKT